jgi:hypothetical protein
MVVMGVYARIGHAEGVVQAHRSSVDSTCKVSHRFRGCCQFRGPEILTNGTVSFQTERLDLLKVMKCSEGGNPLIAGGPALREG